MSRDGSTRRVSPTNPDLCLTRERMGRNRPGDGVGPSTTGHPTISERMHFFDVINQTPSVDSMYNTMQYETNDASAV